MKKILLRNADCYQDWCTSDLVIQFDSNFNTSLEVDRGINDHGGRDRDNIEIRPESLPALIDYLQRNYDLYKQSLQLEACDAESEKSD